MRQLLLAIVVMLAAARPAIAQSASLTTLQPGDTIRVWSTAPRLNGQAGIFDARLRDTLRFTSLSQPTDVPYTTLRRIDVKRGVHRSATRVVIGSLLGAAAGSIVGAYLGTAIECGRTCGDEGEWEGLAGFVFGGGFGIIAGGVTGGIIAGRHRTARWEAVDLRR
jgi:hypothetical protein